MSLKPTLSTSLSAGEQQVTAPQACAGLLQGRKYEQHCLLSVQNSGLSQASQRALQKMVSLFGLTQLVKDLGDLLEDDYASNQQASLVRQQQYAVSTPFQALPGPTGLCC